MVDRRGTPLRRLGRTIPFLALILAFSLLALCQVHHLGSENSIRTGTIAGAKNVILFIGDGMGIEQVRAAGMYAYGSSGTLSFEAFPHRCLVRTHDVYHNVTDSAAAATAMATGVQVESGVISVELPGDLSPLETVLERFQAMGKSTGLVTTTFITHATPAAFGAHRQKRSDYSGIASDYLNISRPQVLFGGARYLTGDAAKRAGYVVVTDREDMLALDTEATSMVSGQFGTDHLPFEFDGTGILPHLSEMTRVALDILDNDPDGLFLMVEGGRIDHAGHANDIERNIRETAEFSRAVSMAWEWAKKCPDTLILVTADHETGGLRVLTNNGIGRAPDVEWSTSGHSGVEVPAYGWGIGASLLSGIIDHSRIYEIILHAAGSGGISLVQEQFAHFPDLRAAGRDQPIEALDRGSALRSPESQ